MIYSEYIKWLKDVTEEDFSKLGYKASRLAELFKYKLPVPKAFVISSQAYFSFLQQDNLKSKISDILDSIDYNSKEDVSKKSEQIQNLFLKTKESQEFKDEVIKKYTMIGAHKVGWLKSSCDEFVAIRGSVVSEVYKSEDTDFLENLTGFLNIRKIDEVIKHIKLTWATLYSPEAIEYVHLKNMDYNELGLAVIVQQMINADISGVMITSKKLGDETTIVEAVYGLGGPTVIKEIAPDHYEVSKKNLGILKKIKDTQDWEIKRVSGVSSKELIDKDRQANQKLDAHDLKDFAILAKKLETLFSMPLYVDWAMEKSDIYILRADPLDPSLKKIKTSKKKELDKGFQDTIDALKKEVILEGISITSGIVNGKVLIVKSPNDLEKITENTIVVTSQTDDSMVPFLKKAKGLITDTGSILCHAAIVSKQLNIPCIVNTKKATSVLKDNQSIQLNGNSGKVYSLSGVELVKFSKQPTQEVTSSQEPIYPPTTTKIIASLNSNEDINNLNFPDIDGVCLSLKSLFSLEELAEFDDSNGQAINLINSKIKKFFENPSLSSKKIYYKLNLYRDSLVDGYFSKHELSCLYELSKSNNNVFILLENIKSENDILYVEEMFRKKTGNLFDAINYSVLEKYISLGIGFVVFDLNIDVISKNKDLINKAIDLCKDNRVIRIFCIKDDFSEEIIKKLIEVRVNEFIVFPNNLKIKDTIFKKEKEIIKNLLSI